MVVFEIGECVYLHIHYFLLITKRILMSLEWLLLVILVLPIFDWLNKKQEKNMEKMRIYK